MFSFLDLDHLLDMVKSSNPATASRHSQHLQGTNKHY